MGFVLFWELWGSCPVAPAHWQDVICVLMKAVLAVGTSQRAASQLELPLWGHGLKGTCPRAHAVGLCDGLSFLVMSLEEA